MTLKTKFYTNPDLLAVAVAKLVLVMAAPTPIFSVATSQNCKQFLVHKSPLF